MTCYTIPEVADIFKVTTRTIHNWIAEGRLPIIKIGKTVRISDEAVKALMDAGHTIKGYPKKIKKPPCGGGKG